MNFTHQKKRPRILLVMEWYSREIHRGIADFAKHANWILDTQMRRSGYPPANWNGDGIICMLSPDSKLADYVRKKNVPAVNVAWKDCPLNVPMILHDDAKIGRMAAEHFISNGFVNLAFYRSEKLAVAFDRGEGFRNMANKSGLNFISLDISSNRSGRAGNPSSRQQWLMDKLKKLPKPLGVFAQNDDHALEVLYACETARIPVPQEVAIVGCDNDELLCTLSSVPLSSIESNQRTLGYQAAVRLNNIIRSKKKYSRPLLVKPAELIIRKSSDITAVNDTDVARAMEFIRENGDRMIGVSDVVSACNSSRRNLYIKFHSAFGYGIAAAITMHRVRLAREMIKKSDMKLHEIARRCGFANLQHMRNTFIRSTGLSPIEFRKSVSDIHKPNSTPHIRK